MAKILQIFLISLAVLTLAQAKPNRVPWWQIKVAKSQGPNACVVEEVPELGKKYYTECKFWPVRKVCGKDPIIRYECCEGYKQIPGEEGCIGVKPLKNVVETARDLGATKFVQYLEDSGIATELTQEGTFTLFVPTNQAFESTHGQITNMKIESFMSSGGDNPVLRYHISDKKYPSRDFSGNNEIQSQYENRQLRISKYSTGMETVNCALISRKDQEANNGIVHVIDSLLDPTRHMPIDVGRVVIEDGRFTKLAEIIQRCNLMGKLQEPGKTYTVLAPSDEAFLKIPRSRYEKILNDPASCQALLENHVVPHVMCLPVITEDYKAKSIGKGKLEFGCDERSHKVENRRMGSDFILGNNGVVYTLDDVLFPDRARTLLELADAHNLNTLAQLLRVAGMEETLSNPGDYTLFAPSEAAWISLDEEILDEAKKNPDLARKVVLYHGAQGRIRTNEIRNNQILQSLDEENQIRMLVYRKSYGVEDAIIETGDIEGYNGIIHVISKVIFPATQSAGDLLRKSANYSLFLEAMETVLQNDPQAIDISLSGTGRDSAGSSHYTFFVPTDDAFRKLGTHQLRRLQTDANYMTKVIRNHVSSQMFSTEAFKPNLIYETPTRQNALAVTCDKQRAFKVNGANVLEKDIVSANGIMHVVDQLILPENGNSNGNGNGNGNGHGNGYGNGHGNGNGNGYSNGNGNGNGYSNGNGNGNGYSNGHSNGNGNNHEEEANEDIVEAEDYEAAADLGAGSDNGYQGTGAGESYLSATEGRSSRGSGAVESSHSSRVQNGRYGYSAGLNGGATHYSRTSSSSRNGNAHRYESRYSLSNGADATYHYEE